MQPDERGSLDIADPYDFSVLSKGIEQAHAKLRKRLSKLHGGGKLNPEVIEALKVRLDKGPVTERLSNVAQVIPRGRTLQVIAGEKEVRPTRLSYWLETNGADD